MKHWQYSEEKPYALGRTPLALRIAYDVRQQNFLLQIRFHLGEIGEREGIYVG
jgi:hypothetical protein